MCTTTNFVLFTSFQIPSHQQAYDWRFHFKKYKWCFSSEDYAISRVWKHVFKQKYNLWFTSQIMLYKYILLHYYHNTFTSVLKLAYLACHRAIKFYQTILAGTNASHNSRACMEFQREHTKPGMLVGFTRTLSIALLQKAFSPPVI